MSTAVVRSAICSLLIDQDCLESVQQYRDTKEEVRLFVQAITKDDSHLDQFDLFATQLMKLLNLVKPSIQYIIITMVKVNSTVNG